MTTSKYLPVSCETLFNIFYSIVVVLEHIQIYKTLALRWQVNVSRRSYRFDQ